MNTTGIRRIMFAVADISDVVARLQKHGAELVGEIVQYEDIYRLCYMSGPEGIMIALAEQLGNKSVKDILEKSSTPGHKIARNVNRKAPGSLF